MTAPAESTRRRRRRGFTLIEVFMAFTILAGALLGMAGFMLNYSRGVNDQSDRTLAYDLATSRLEQLRGASKYRNLDSLYNNVNETWPSTDQYSGFKRVTAVRRTQSTTLDYMTVTVKVTGRRLAQPVAITSIIAIF
jgi:Tfp pilus assembly protein PilV